MINSNALRELEAVRAASYPYFSKLIDALHDSGYSQDVQGDAVEGDDVVFLEAVFTGYYPNVKFTGYRLITGRIEKESYGEKKQQHTFSIRVSGCYGSGWDKYAVGDCKRIKGRNLYKYFTLARPRGEDERSALLRDKHRRGDAARRARRERKEKAMLFD